MLTWVIYDVSDDRRRTKIAKVCQEYGLYRIQKSVFLGNIDENRMDEIAQFSANLIDCCTDAVFVLPCCEKDFSKRITIGKKDYDEEMVQGTKRSLFL